MNRKLSTVMKTTLFLQLVFLLLTKAPPMVSESTECAKSLSVTSKCLILRKTINCLIVYLPVKSQAEEIL